MSQLKPPPLFSIELGDANITPEREDLLSYLQDQADATDHIAAEFISDITPIVLRLPEGLCEEWGEFTSETLAEIASSKADDNEQVIAACRLMILDKFYLQLTKVLDTMEHSFLEQMERHNSLATRLRIAADPRFPLWLKIYRFYISCHRGSPELRPNLKEWLQQFEETQMALRLVAKAARSSAQSTTKRNKPKRKKR